MQNILTWLSRQRFPYEPLINVLISKNALINNIREFMKIAPHNSVAPVLKSNAYGHGLIEIATILEHERKHLGAESMPFFVVDSYFEAVALRSRGIKTPLLIIGYTRSQTIMRSRLNNVSFMIGSLETLQEIENVEKDISIHLKIDTGMRRQGLLPDELDHVTELLSENIFIHMHGLCSHLSDADNIDPSFTEGQINVWNRCVSKFRSQFSSLKYFHLSATDGHHYTHDIDANVSRLGIGMYGLAVGDVFNPQLHLKPVLEMKTIISSIRNLKRDETVGYGNTFKTDADKKIATIPVGYFEGVDRRLSNIGSVEIGHDHVACPIIGRVSMNISTIDVTHADNAKIGDEVTVISANFDSKNSILEIAKKCNTIPYEIAIHIPEHLKRIVVE